MKVWKLCDKCEFRTQKVLHSLTYQQRIIFLISTLDFLTLIHLSRVFRNTELRDQDKAHNTWDLEVNSETLYSETGKKVFHFLKSVNAFQKKYTYLHLHSNILNDVNFGLEPKISTQFEFYLKTLP